MDCLLKIDVCKTYTKSGTGCATWTNKPSSAEPFELKDVAVGKMTILRVVNTDGKPSSAKSYQGDGCGLGKPDVLGLIDRCHAAFADPFDDAPLLDLFAEQWSFFGIVLWSEWLALCEYLRRCVMSGRGEPWSARRPYLLPTEEMARAWDLARCWVLSLGSYHYIISAKATRVSSMSSWVKDD